MLNKYFFLLLLWLSFTVNAQEGLFIHLDTQTGKVDKVYVLENSGIFVLDKRAKLEAVIIGKFKKNKTLKVINDYENERIPQRFKTKNTQILSYHLSEINYPNKYAVKEEKYRDYPASINHYSLSYYDNYYDKKSIKGKIKSVGDVKLKYYNSYYLEDTVKGSLSQIGNYKIKLNTHYYKPESFGLINQIGNIKLKYSKSNYNDELNGLVVSIGNYKIKYFDKAYEDSNRLGQFKKLEGEDKRFILLN